MSNQGLASSRISSNFLVPAYYPDDTRFIAGPVKPNNFYAKGTVMGIVTSANATEVQTLTASGTPASGAWAFQIAPVNAPIIQSAVMQWNAVLATVQAQADAVFGAGNCVVSGSWGAGYVFTGAGSLLYGDLPPITIYSNTMQTSAPAAITITVTETTKGVKNGVIAAYASGNSDGTQTAVGLLETDVFSDIYGNIVYGNGPGGGNGPGTTGRYAVKGFYKTTDLVGLDSTAVTALGRIVQGVLANGVLALR